MTDDHVLYKSTRASLCSSGSIQQLRPSVSGRVVLWCFQRDVGVCQCAVAVFCDVYIRESHTHTHTLVVCEARTQHLATKAKDNTRTKRPRELTIVAVSLSPWSLLVSSSSWVLGTAPVNRHRKFGIYAYSFLVSDGFFQRIFQDAGNCDAVLLLLLCCFRHEQKLTHVWYFQTRHKRVQSTWLEPYPSYSTCKYCI